MLICELNSGEKIHRREETLIVYFPGPRRVVSTAWVNGGCREDLQAVFNHHLTPHQHVPASLPGGSVEGFRQGVFDPERYWGCRFYPSWYKINEAREDFGLFL